MLRERGTVRVSVWWGTGGCCYRLHRSGSLRVLQGVHRTYNIGACTRITVFILAPRVTLLFSYFYPLNLSAENIPVFLFTILSPFSSPSFHPRLFIYLLPFIYFVKPKGGRTTKIKHSDLGQPQFILFAVSHLPSHNNFNWKKYTTFF